MTCDFQPCGILTSVDSDEPVQSPFKLRNSKWCLVSSLTFKPPAKALIRLCVCAGWSEALLVAHTTLLEISCRDSFMFLSEYDVYQKLVKYLYHPILLTPLWTLFFSHQSGLQISALLSAYILREPKAAVSQGSSLIWVHIVCFHDKNWSEMHLNICRRGNKQMRFSGQNYCQNKGSSSSSSSSSSS